MRSFFFLCNRGPYHAKRSWPKVIFLVTYISVFIKFKNILHYHKMQQNIILYQYILFEQRNCFWPASRTHTSLFPFWNRRQTKQFLTKSCYFLLLDNEFLSRLSTGKLQNELEAQDEASYVSRHVHCCS